MGVAEDVQAVQDAAAKVAADLAPTGELEYGTYVKTPTATGYTLELVKGEPPAPPAAEVSQA